MSNTSSQASNLTLPFGHEELVIKRRYEVASILNDFLIALWFLVGSVLFLYPAWKEIGVWLFIVASAQFMVRPTIRLAHHLHLSPAATSHWDM